MPISGSAGATRVPAVGLNLSLNPEFMYIFMKLPYTYLRFGGVKCVWEMFVWGFGVLFLSCACVCRCPGGCSLSVCVCVTC